MPPVAKAGSNGTSPPARKRLKRVPQPIGESGRQHYQGFISQDEANHDLVGVNGLRIYDRMWRSDGDIRKALQMLVSLFASASRTIEPYRDKDEAPTEEDETVARFVEWTLMERMRPKLDSYVTQVGRVAGRSGFAPFEELLAIDEWEGRQVITLDGLDLRLPRTIHRWLQDGPRLQAIEQFTAHKGTVVIPADRLVYHRLGVEGDNWEGESLLRAAYKHWRYKDSLELVDAMAHERFSMGLPVAYIPQNTGADDAAVEELEVALSEIRANERGYLIMPGPKQGSGAEPNDGWLVEILTPDRTDSNGALVESMNYHSSRIAASVLEEFMRLGQDAVGARATADVQQDPFLMFAEAINSTLIEDPINEQLIPRLVDLNFDTHRYPQLVTSLIDSTSMTELAAFIQSLVAAGALHPDQVLEDWLREQADFPKADPAAVAERERVDAAMREQTIAGPQLEPGEPARSPSPANGGNQRPSEKRDDKPAKTLQLSRQDRALKPWEQLIQLDRIEGALDGAKARLEAAATPAAIAAAARMAGQRDPKLNANPPQELVDAILTELETLYTLGRQTVADELAAQRGAQAGQMTLADDSTPGQDRKALSERARVAALSIMASTWRAIRRARLRLGRRDRAEEQAAAEAAARAAARQEGILNATAAVNLGRDRTAEDHADEIIGARYTSILDPNRCAVCAVADDDVLRRLDDPVRLARRPPNRGCQGGDRCRCMEFFQLRGETPARGGGAADVAGVTG